MLLKLYQCCRAAPLGRSDTIGEVVDENSDIAVRWFKDTGRGDPEQLTGAMFGGDGWRNKNKKKRHFAMPSHKYYNWLVSTFLWS